VIDGRDPAFMMQFVHADASTLEEGFIRSAAKRPVSEEIEGIIATAMTLTRKSSGALLDKLKRLFLEFIFGRPMRIEDGRGHRSVESAERIGQKRRP